jgi:hypothetical protein
MQQIYFNEDNHHFYGYHPASDMSVDGVKALVDSYAKTGSIKGLLFCTNVQRALFDSEVWERFRDIDASDPLVQNLRLLSERGIDQFAIWLERCKHHEIEGWLSMRMNDSHGLKEAETGDHSGWIHQWPSEYWRANRHLRRAPYRLERSWEGSFNYLLKEVRDHHLRLVEELFDRYDMAGLELDWMRWGTMFPPGSERQGQEVLTAFVQQVRVLADKAEARYGHPVKLAHRLPSHPESCLNFGFDPITWGEAGCVDMVTLSSFLGSGIFDPQIKLWRRLLPTGTTLNVYVDPCVASYPGNLVMRDEVMLGQTAAAWSCGADNIYLFNECYRQSEEPERLQTLLAIMGDKHVLQKTPRSFAVTHDRMTIAGESARTVLPIPLKQKKIGVEMGRMEETITLRLPAGKVNADAECLLRLGFSTDAEECDASSFEVRVNTQTVSPGVWPKAAEFAPGRRYYTPYPFLPHDAASALVFSVPAALLGETFNAIEILPPQVAGSLVWAELLVR